MYYVTVGLQELMRHDEMTYQLWLGSNKSCLNLPTSPHHLPTPPPHTIWCKHEVCSTKAPPFESMPACNAMLFFAHLPEYPHQALQGWILTPSLKTWWKALVGYCCWRKPARLKTNGRHCRLDCTSPFLLEVIVLGHFLGVPLVELCAIEGGYCQLVWGHQLLWTLDHTKDLRPPQFLPFKHLFCCIAFANEASNMMRFSPSL